MVADIFGRSRFMPGGQKGFMAGTMNPWVGHWLADWLVVLRITGSLSVSGFGLSFIWPQ